MTLEDLIYEAHYLGIKEECFILCEKIRNREGYKYLDFGQRFAIAFYEIKKHNGTKQK